MKVEVGWRSADLSALPSKLFFFCRIDKENCCTTTEKLLNALNLAEDFFLCVFFCSVFLI